METSTASAITRAILSPAFLKSLTRAPIEAVLVFAEGNYIFCRKQEKSVMTKLLTGEAICAAFADQPVDSGWLNPNIVRWGMGIRGDWCVAYYPPARSAINVLPPGSVTQETWSVPLPGFCFIGVGTSYYVWSLKGERFSPDAIAYQAPLPNVYNTGKVCWGTNSSPVASPATMSAAWQLFLTSPFNGDLVGGKARSHANDVRLLLRRLSSKKRASFPEAELYPLGHQRTIAEAIDNIIFERNDN